MKVMQRNNLIFVALVLVLLNGCSSTSFDLITGTYPVKVKSLTYLDLISEDLRELRSNEAEMLESKPGGLEIDFPYEQFDQVRFGSFNLGNNEQKIYFMMVNGELNSNEIEGAELYLDQDLDHRITKKERIKGLQTNQDVIKGIQRTQSFGLIPFPLQISYKGEANQFSQKLYFFVLINLYQKKGLNDIVVNLIDAGFIEGEIKILKNGSPRAVKFRIMDANSNGCFNDYGTDLMFFDFDNDGFFRRNESQELAEFYTVTRDGAPEQVRMIVAPYPAKIAIVKANEAYAVGQLEPLVTVAVSDANNTPAPTPTERAIGPARANENYR
ncbi:MAG: hypothetical protein K6U80_00625 [Firmicutes bacterium]|nr:hypothetical protein [Bacillota bacterium]